MGNGLLGLDSSLPCEVSGSGSFELIREGPETRYGKMDEAIV